MDPDLPYPSVEGKGQQEMQNANRSSATGKPAASPRPPKTPLKTRSQSPSHAQTPAAFQRSPSSASSPSERLSSPSLRTQRSFTSLNNRGVTPQFRRASSNLNPASPVITQKNGSMTPEAQHKSWTPSAVADAFFVRDLDQHAATPSKTVVIVHDSCYGHRFSRPRTTKTALSLIVERPERIRATMLGTSLAYVRLGGRHADGSHPPHPETQPPAQAVPFQIRKITRNIALNHAAVTAVHGLKWMEELQIMCDSAEAKLALNGKELVRPIGYGKDETGKTLPKLHEGDLYLCSETLAALQGCLGGVCEAVDTVFSNTLTKRAFVCIRPPGHHCSSDFPSGFCWLNNVHVGITYAAMNHGLTHAAIIDFDLHHGDGSQAIAWDHNTKAKELPKHAASHKKIPIGYYSLHDINSFPCEWGDEDKVRNASVCLENAHGLSIWNVHLEGWKDHAEFWKLYETRYTIILEKTRKFLKHHSAALRASGVQPKAAIFLSAGFDASEWEGAGMQRHGVNVPTDFYARFTTDIVAMSQEEHLGVDERIVSVLEGGYSDRALMSGVMSHICGLVDDNNATQSSEGTRGLGTSMAAMGTNGASSNTQEPRNSLPKHDTSWWNVESLETIEAVVAGRLPPHPKDTTESTAGNYSSPTQASNARMTEVARERRSLNAQLEARLSLMDKPIPPPPDVDWSVAAHALSQLIIPSNRQTTSCRPADLNAEATRMRKERQSGIGSAFVPSAVPMQLRERKPKVPALPTAVARSNSRTRSEHRRTTIASFNDLPDPNMPIPPLPADAQSRSRRRSSAASSIVSGLSAIKLNDEVENGTKLNAAAPPDAHPGGRSITGAVKSGAARKPRAVGPKSAVAGKAPTRKAPPVGPPFSRQTSTGSDTQVAAAPKADSSHIGQASAFNDSSADLDAITSSMSSISLKSIKLKMPSREQHDANQRKLEDDQQKVNKPAKVTRKPPVPRASKPKAKPSTGGIQLAAPIASSSTATTKPEAGSPTPLIPIDLHGRPTDVSDSQSMAQEPMMTTILPANSYAQQPAAVDSQVSEKIPAKNLDTENTMPSAPQLAMNNAQGTASFETGITNGTAPSSNHEQAPAVEDHPPTWIPVQHAHPLVDESPMGTKYQNHGLPFQSDSGFSAQRPGTPHRHVLPKFTSTSPIPFGRAASASPLKFGKDQENEE